MALAGIEIRYLVNKMSSFTQGYYVSNVYGISHESLLVKLHHPEYADVLLMVTTRGIWPTRSKINPIEPNSMVSRLRKSLQRHRLVNITQLDEERIVVLSFEGLDTKMKLVCEFFGGGNVILCDHQDKIHALMRTVDVKHRTLRVGEQYTRPPGLELGAIGPTIDDISQIQHTSLGSAKWLARCVGLPSRYIEKIFADAKIDPKTLGKDLSRDSVVQIHAALESIVYRVINGDHAPETVDTDKEIIINPVNLVAAAKPALNQTFEELIDAAFTQQILDAGKSLRTSQTQQQISQLQSQLAEQTRAIDLVREQAGKISDVAKDLQALATSGITLIQDEEAKKMLAGHDALVISKRGRSLVRIGKCEVSAPPTQSLYAIASLLWDESKIQAAAESRIAARRTKIQADLDALSKKSDTLASAIRSKTVRKKAWYERYRWFKTTDGLLAVGGRDSSSNTSLVRKKLEDGDIIFHANVFGSPFFILKGGADAPPASLKETAQATVCFSRAWREQMHGIDAYWVRPEQVKRAAPSGQFLPKGSFSIEGQRNFVKAPTLRLAIGVVNIDDSYVVSCGPLDAIRTFTVCHTVIEPGGLLQTDISKRVKSELARINDTFGSIDLDEITRALPSGHSRIAKMGQDETR